MSIFACRESFRDNLSSRWSRYIATMGGRKREVDGDNLGPRFRPVFKRFLIRFSNVREEN